MSALEWAVIRSQLVAIRMTLHDYEDITDNDGPNDAMKMEFAIDEVIDLLDWLNDK